MEHLDEFGITEDAFLDRLEFMLENEYLGTTTTRKVFYNAEVRTTVEIEYIRKIAAHFKRPPTKVLSEGDRPSSPESDPSTE